jgi:ABC-2 type transport system ATP-binding protein
MTEQNKTQTAIKVQYVDKLFKLPHERQSSIKSLVVNFYRRNRSYELQKALENISLDVKKGEFFGVIGRNGSGKSTLLKMLAGIYFPSKGNIQINGSLTPFIELGVGFNHELTGRENVFLNGALLGFSRAEMQRMYKDIVEFAELEKFMDQKLKNYSSGMQVRLAFSIAIRAESDILLIDEVLAVGDLAFQEKCYAFFDKIKASERTVVFISHDSSAVQRFCDRVAIIDKGKLVDVGEPKRMVLKYGAIIASDQYDSAVKEVEDEIHQGTGDVTITDVKVIAKNGRTSSSIEFQEPFSIEVHYKLKREIKEDVIAGIDIIDDEGVSILGPNTKEAGQEVYLNKKGVIKVDFPANPLAPKTYSITAGIFDNNESFAYDLVEHFRYFKVIGPAKHGKIYLEPVWKTDVKEK